MDHEMFDSVEFLKDGKWCKAIFIGYKKGARMCTVSSPTGYRMIFSTVPVEDVRKPFTLPDTNPNKMFKKGI